jgi:hypothetical protein
VRVLLILVIVGSAISLVVQAVSLVRRAAHHTQQGGAPEHKDLTHPSRCLGLEPQHVLGATPRGLGCW